MGKSLARFLADVAVDPDRLERFLTEPERSIDEAGLGRRDREALLSGDQGAVLARLTPSAEPVPAEPVDDRKENGGMWFSPMVDPAAGAAGPMWHYAAQDAAAGTPMWHYAAPAGMWLSPSASAWLSPGPAWHAPGPMWHQPGPTAAAFAAPPPMWLSGGVSVVHVVHHIAGPAPAPPAQGGPSEHSGD